MRREPLPAEAWRASVADLGPSASRATRGHLFPRPSTALSFEHAARRVSCTRSGNFPMLARRRTSCYRIVVGPVSTRIEDLRRERGTLVMGVLNVTPDSFFDGGRYDDVGNAARHIDQLLTDGADLIDIGAESTRPGAAAIPADE